MNMSDRKTGALKPFWVAGLLCVGAAAIAQQNQTPAQSQARPERPARPAEAPPPSREEMEKLRAAVEANPDDLETHKAYLKGFASGDEAKAQYEQWMKKYPQAAAVPRALGEKYGTYSPKSREYLLKAAQLQPNDSELWQKLALDASIRGDKKTQHEYMKKAAAADPSDVSLQYAVLDDSGGTTRMQKVFELAKKYPTHQATATALHLGGFSHDINESISTWERLRPMFPKGDMITYQVAMSRLGDAYIQTGQYAKAIELSEDMMAKKAAGRLNFAPKAELARKLAAIDAKMKEGKPAEARALIDGVQSSQRNLLDNGNRVVLTKATVLDATGSTQQAYEELLAYQARTPDRTVAKEMEKYGSKLNKSTDQVKRDVRAAVAKNSEPAPSFVVDSYTTPSKKVRLEDFKGKVMLVSFWYPACGPCRGEMPHMEAGIRNLDRSKFVYLGINGHRNEDAFVDGFLKASGYSFTPLGASPDTTGQFGVRGFPSNFIIDQDGRIAYSGFMVDEASEETLELMLRSLIDVS
jgi:thiol-disulfide isomerase/thioredoxin